MSARAGDRGVGRRGREQRDMVGQAETAREIVERRLGGAPRLDAARQIVGGLAHGAQPLA